MTLPSEPMKSQRTTDIIAKDTTKNCPIHHILEGITATLAGKEPKAGAGCACMTCIKLAIDAERQQAEMWETAHQKLVENTVDKVTANTLIDLLKAQAEAAQGRYEHWFKEATQARGQAVDLEKKLATLEALLDNQCADNDCLYLKKFEELQAQKVKMERVVEAAKKVKVERDGCLTKNVLITCKAIDELCEALKDLETTDGK